MSRLRAVVLAFALISATGVAYADYPTIDITAIKELGKQLSELKKQYTALIDQLNVLKESLNFLSDITKFMNEVSSAIGALTHIDLPIPRIDKFARQIQSDVRCLMPDGDGWGINFKDVNLGSICDLTSTYKAAFFVDTKKLKKVGFNEQEAMRHLAEANRTAFFQDTVTRSLAQADVLMKQIEELNSAADDLQSNLKSAETVQDRLHVQAQSGILQARAQAAQSQVMVQMLRLEAAGQMAAGLSVDAVKDAVEEEGKK